MCYSMQKRDRPERELLGPFYFSRFSQSQQTNKKTESRFSFSSFFSSFRSRSFRKWKKKPTRQALHMCKEQGKRKVITERSGDTSLNSTYKSETGSILNLVNPVLPVIPDRFPFSHFFKIACFAVFPNNQLPLRDCSLRVRPKRYKSPQRFLCRASSGKRVPRKDERAEKEMMLLEVCIPTGRTRAVAPGRSEKGPYSNVRRSLPLPPPLL